jgi:hypothetical protein
MVRYRGWFSGAHWRDPLSQSDLYAQRDLLNRIKLMLPVQSSSQKYFPSSPTQITSMSFASRPNTTGAFRDRHERRAGDAVDAVAPRTNGAFRGRRSRVVLTPRRRRQVGERDFTCDGDKKARSPGRARNKLLKPSRAGMPGDPGATVVTNARAYYSTRAAAGATGTRHSPRPLWAKDSSTTRAHRAAGTRSCISPSLRGAKATKQSSSPMQLMDCFAEPVIGRAFARPVGSQMTAWLSASLC